MKLPSSLGRKGERLGPILYQLPPRWPINLERFEHFLRALAPSWTRAAASASISARAGTAGLTTTPASTSAPAGWLHQADQGRSVFAYFNNEAGGHAPRDAVRLRNGVKRRLAA